jgi:7,8-dihydroneopterin aldolase/epimerase/oxygenase
MGRIHIQGMEFYSYHGLLKEETKIGGRFVVEILIDTDFTRAATHDDIEGTVDYSEVYDLVKAEMDIPSKLIEHVAGRIKTRLLDRLPSIELVEVTVEKIRPPVKGIMASVRVTV